jgi:hypothetical protein
MGIIFDVDGLPDWHFEARQGSMRIIPPTEDTIICDRCGETDGIEMSNEDMMILQHVLGEAIKRMRPPTKEPSK